LYGWLERVTVDTTAGIRTTTAQATGQEHRIQDFRRRIREKITRPGRQRVLHDSGATQMVRQHTGRQRGQADIQGPKTPTPSTNVIWQNETPASTLNTITIGTARGVPPAQHEVSRNSD